MAERQPMRVSVAIEAWFDAMATFPPLKQALLGCFVRWMCVNATPLPADLNACCEIAKARSMEARRSVAELTGLEPVPPGQEGLSPRDNSVPPGQVFCPPGTSLVPPGQGEAFEGYPGGGLTLRSDRAWGIEPLLAEDLLAKARRQEREHKQRQRARKTAVELSRGDSENLSRGDSCARNSVIPIPIPNTNTEIQRALTHPSGSFAHAARAHAQAHTHVREAEAEQPAVTADTPPGTPEGRRRGEALKAMRACGLTGVNGLHPDFLALLATGITDEELRWGAEDAVAKGKGFPYAVRALLGARQDAAAASPTLVAAPRLSAWEQRARELAGPLGIGYKPPT